MYSFILRILGFLGLGFLLKKHGRTEERLEQNEKALEKVKKQRDVNINNVYDARRLFKNLRDK